MSPAATDAPADPPPPPGDGDATTTPLLEIRGISKTFPGVRALHDVSMSVRAGEIRALIGENGAGKSTLMNILDGVYSDYAGELRVDGRRIAMRSPRHAQSLGISMIHQELQLVPELSIAENIYLGREPRTPVGTVDAARMRRDATALLRQLELDIPATRPIRRCRLAEQQLVEVAKAISFEARVLIMDEPTSALADAEIAKLFEIIRGLSARGVAIIYISHRLEELFELAESITVLRDGELVDTRPIGEVTHDELIRMMVGRPLTEFFVKETGGAAAADDVALAVEHLGLVGDRAVGRRALRDVSFQVRRGEIVGIAGLMGAGRTEVLETIFGVHPRRLVSGTVSVDGRLVTIRSPRQAIRRGIAFLTEDRKGQSLMVILSVRFNVTISSLRRIVRWFGLDRRRERSLVGAMIERLRIKTPSGLAIVNNLSGGNQQKVALAKSLLTDPKIVLMDEPTRGIDVGAKSEIYALVSELARSGAAVVMVSSEIGELLAMSDRILVLCEGRLTADIPGSTATQEAIMHAATPTGTLAHGG